MYDPFMVVVRVVQKLHLQPNIKQEQQTSSNNKRKPHVRLDKGSRRCLEVAEGEGFEPSVGCPTFDFESKNRRWLAVLCDDVVQCCPFRAFSTTC